MQTGRATMENSMEVPHTLKIELPYNPTVPLLDIYLEKNKNMNSKRYMHPRVHCSTIYNSPDTEAPKCPSTDKQIKKISSTCTMEY